MKIFRTINREIEERGFSILKRGYFNFHTTHSTNTFIFREFVDCQRKSFLKALSNKDFILILDADIGIIAYKNFEEAFIQYPFFNRDELKADYDKYLEQYRN